MENIKKSIKDQDFSVVFFWGKGCPACEQTKPAYFKYVRQYKDLNLLDVEFNQDSYEFYSQFAEKVQDQTPVLDDNGEVKLDEEGTPIFKPKVDDEGKPVMVPKIVVPNFFIFSKEKRQKDNELGFIGSVEGHNPEKMEELLLVLKYKKKGANFL